MSITKVVGVDCRSDGDGVRCEVHVARAFNILSFPPSTEDVPRDIRDALRAWLDTGEPQCSAMNSQGTACSVRGSHERHSFEAAS